MAYSWMTCTVLDLNQLIDCWHGGIGVHNCDHTDDAGVRCQGA